MNWQGDFRELARKKRTEFEEAEERQRRHDENVRRVIGRFGPIIEDVARVLNGDIYKGDGFDHDRLIKESSWHLSVGGIRGVIEISFHCDSIFMEYEHRPYYNGGPTSHSEYVSLRDTHPKRTLHEWDNVGPWDPEDERILEDRIRKALARCIRAIQP